MGTKGPSVVVIGGPNGAGKSTAAPFLLKGALGVTEFVNADVIAQGLSAFQPERAGITAGRIMLARLKELANQRVSFAFETTLASRMFAPWITKISSTGYGFHLAFLWLPNASLAIQRVAERVRLGGHDVPEETIVRRYNAGLKNFFALYQGLTTSWRFYDNSSSCPGMELIASGKGAKITNVVNDSRWHQVAGTDSR
jgi:predicted ABC-type ATPase